MILSHGKFSNVSHTRHDIRSSCQALLCVGLIKNSPIWRGWGDIQTKLWQILKMVLLTHLLQDDQHQSSSRSTGCVVTCDLCWLSRFICVFTRLLKFIKKLVLCPLCLWQENRQENVHVGFRLYILTFEISHHKFGLQKKLFTLIVCKTHRNCWQRLPFFCELFGEGKQQDLTSWWSRNRLMLWRRCLVFAWLTHGAD